MFEVHGIGRAARGRLPLAGRSFSGRAGTSRAPHAATFAGLLTRLPAGRLAGLTFPLSAAALLLATLGVAATLLLSVFLVAPLLSTWPFLIPGRVLIATFPACLLVVPRLVAGIARGLRRGVAAGLVAGRLGVSGLVAGGLFSLRVAARLAGFLPATAAVLRLLRSALAVAGLRAWLRTLLSILRLARSEFVAA